MTRETPRVSSGPKGVMTLVCQMTPGPCVQATRRCLRNRSLVDLIGVFAVTVLRFFAASAFEFLYAGSVMRGMGAASRRTDRKPPPHPTLALNLVDAPRLSLLDQGYLDRPSAPMLLVNGEKDSQQPIADLYLLMKHGDPKDVWVNPDGGHMGRSEKWPQGKIVEEVVMPWIERKLAISPVK